MRYAFHLTFVLMPGLNRNSEYIIAPYVDKENDIWINFIFDTPEALKFAKFKRDSLHQNKLRKKPSWSL